jgi:hypothetical protein
MNVDDPIFKSPKEVSFEHAHEPGQHDKIDAALLKRTDVCLFRTFLQLCSELAGSNKTRGNAALTSAIWPDAHASAIATKFEPLPEPSTPMRNSCSLFTRFSYSHGAGRGKLSVPRRSRSRLSIPSRREYPTGMQRLYHILADAILVAHVLIVLFNAGALPLIWIGGLRGWQFVRNFAFRITHLAMTGFVAAEALVGMICPLTTWENALRTRAGGPAYSEGFIAHWLQRLLFYDWDERVFTVAYTVFFALVLLTFLAVKPNPPKWRRRHRQSRTSALL